MRIYVAGSLKEASRVRALMGTLRAQGHEITHDWTEGPIPEDGDAGLSDITRAQIARACTNGVHGADLVVLLLSDSHAQRGSHTEFGMALAAKHDPICVIVGTKERRSQCALYHFADFAFATDAVFARWIGGER